MPKYYAEKVKRLTQKIEAIDTSYFERKSVEDLRDMKVILESLSDLIGKPIVATSQNPSAATGLIKLQGVYASLTPPEEAEDEDTKNKATSDFFNAQRKWKTEHNKFYGLLFDEKTRELLDLHEFNEADFVGTEEHGGGEKRDDLQKEDVQNAYSKLSEAIHARSLECLAALEDKRKPLQVQAIKYSKDAIEAMDQQLKADMVALGDIFQVSNFARLKGEGLQLKHEAAGTDTPEKIIITLDSNNLEITQDSLKSNDATKHLAKAPSFSELVKEFEQAVSSGNPTKNAIDFMAFVRGLDPLKDKQSNFQVVAGRFKSSINVAKSTDKLVITFNQKESTDIPADALNQYGLSLADFDDDGTLKEGVPSFLLIALLTDKFAQGALGLLNDADRKKTMPFFNYFKQHELPKIHTHAEHRREVLKLVQVQEAIENAANLEELEKATEVLDIPAQEPSIEVSAEQDHLATARHAIYAMRQASRGEDNFDEPTRPLDYRTPRKATHTVQTEFADVDDKGVKTEIIKTERFRKYKIKLDADSPQSSSTNSPSSSSGKQAERPDLTRYRGVVVKQGELVCISKVIETGKKEICITMDSKSQVEDHSKGLKDPEELEEVAFRMAKQLLINYDPKLGNIQLRGIDNKQLQRIHAMLLLIQRESNSSLLKNMVVESPAETPDERDEWTQKGRCDEFIKANLSKTTGGEVTSRVLGWAKGKELQQILDERHKALQSRERDVVSKLFRTRVQEERRQASQALKEGQSVEEAKNTRNGIKPSR